MKKHFRNSLLILLLTLVVNFQYYAQVLEVEPNNNISDYGVITVSTDTLLGSIGNLVDDPHDFWKIQPNLHGDYQFFFNLQNGDTTNISLSIFGSVSGYPSGGTSIVKIYGNNSVTISLDSTKFYTLLVNSTSVYMYDYTIEFLKYQNPGTPTAHEPNKDSKGRYEIASLENLSWITASNELVAIPTLIQRLRSEYVQVADINAAETRTWYNGEGWRPIGYYNGPDDTIPFTGEYNGNGYYIDSLFVNGQANTGFFGLIENSIISQVRLTNLDIIGTSSVGGLVGFLRDSEVNLCLTSGKVATQTGGVKIGGLVGVSNRSIIISSTNQCSVMGGEYAGGLVGSNYDGIITRSFSSGDVFGSFENIGGFVGINTGNIFNSYSSGDVSGFKFVGGFAGRSDSPIQNSYSIGNVSGISDSSGFVGTSSFDNPMINCFWNTDTDGNEASQPGWDNFGATGLSTNEIKEREVFLNSDWDFTHENQNGVNDYWDIDKTHTINDGYPFLRWQIMDKELQLDSISIHPFIIHSGDIGLFANNHTSLTLKIFESDTSIVPSNFVSINKYWQITNLIGEIKLRLYFNPYSLNNFSSTPKILAQNNGEWFTLPSTDTTIIIRNYLGYIETTEFIEYAGTFTIGDTANVSLLNENASSIPNSYCLFTNYPNPFNPSTTITFSLPKSSNVKIIIYSSVGQEIKTLLNERKQVGSYKINFDGSSLSSGVYFYQIIADDFIDTKKMVLIK